MKPEPETITDPAPIEPRFIREINGRQFVTYSGLLEMARTAGLDRLEVEVLQYPSESNANCCVCLATAELKTGKSAKDIGEASKANLDSRVAEFLFSMASTRAKARALRNLLGIGITALEELGSFSDVIPEEPKYNPEPKADNTSSGAKSTQPSAQTEGPAFSSNRITPKQRKYILTLSTEAGIARGDLQDHCKAEYGAVLDHISREDASKLIELLMRDGLTNTPKTNSNGNGRFSKAA